MATNVKFRGVNRADSFDELGHVDGVPAGLRALAHSAIDQLPDSEVEVEFNHDINDGGMVASVAVRILGPSRKLPINLTRDQIVEARNSGFGIPKG